MSPNSAEPSATLAAKLRAAGLPVHDDGKPCLHAYERYSLAEGGGWINCRWGDHNNGGCWVYGERGAYEENCRRGVNLSGPNAVYPGDVEPYTGWEITGGDYPDSEYFSGEFGLNLTREESELLVEQIRQESCRVCGALLKEERNSLCKEDVDEWETVVAYTACDVEVQVGRAKQICGDAYFIQVTGYETQDEVLQRSYDSGEEAEAAALKWAEDSLDAILEAKRQEVGCEDGAENERHGIRP
jgi:hypothetical protein